MAPHQRVAQPDPAPELTAPATFGVMSIPDAKVSTINGSAPAFSADGTSLAYVGRDGADTALMSCDRRSGAAPTVVRKGPERIDAPGCRRRQPRRVPDDAEEDWEIFVVNRDGSGETRVTREIQHDLLPRFLEPRPRCSA